MDRMTHASCSRARGATGIASLAIAFALCLLPRPVQAVRPQRTVFQNQPVDWSPETAKDNALPSLVFQPAWTWNGFRAPLAGDPVLCSDSIVATSRDGDMVALVPATGEVRWTSALKEAAGFGPATDGALVFQASAAGRLTAVQGSDGHPAWSIDLPARMAVPLRVLGARLLVGTIDGELLSIETAGGRIAARCFLPGRPSAPPEPAPRSLLVGTDHGFVLALDEGSLTTRWSHSAGPAVTSAALFDRGRVYFAAADRSLRCLRFRSGRQTWRARLGAVSTARPIVLKPYLYVLCYDDDIYVLNARNGHQLTRVRLGHRLDSDPLNTGSHLMVVPFTEASVVGLALPRLQTVGRYALEAPGEWFTTSPIRFEDRIAVGYGRNEGRILALTVSQKKPEPAAPEASSGAAQPPPASGAPGP